MLPAWLLWDKQSDLYKLLSEMEIMGIDLKPPKSVLPFQACHPLRKTLGAVAPDLLGPLVAMLNYYMFLLDSRSLTKSI